MSSSKNSNLGPLCRSQTTYMFLKHRQVAVEAASASTNAQAPITSIPQARATNPQNSSSATTQVAVAVVIGVVFISLILLLIYRQYMKRFVREERRRHRRGTMPRSRQDPLWSCSRRPTERSNGARGATVGELHGTAGKGSCNSFMRGTDRLITSRTGLTNPSTEISSSSYSSTTMTSSTDVSLVSSTRAVPKGPTHTITYPPKAHTKLRKYPSLYEDSESSSGPSGSSSPVSPYQTAHPGKKTQAETSSRWPSDRSALSGHIQDSGNWYKVSGWYPTRSASSTVASFSKL